MYHRFDRIRTPRKLSSVDFEQQIRYLRRRYRLVPLVDLVNRVSEGRPLDDCVALTVDDGYADFLDYAYPVIERYRVPVTVFLVSDFVDQRIWLWFDQLRHVCDTAPAGDYTLSILDTTLRSRLEGSVERQALWSRVADICLAQCADVRSAQISSLAQQMRVEIPLLPDHEHRAMDWDSLRGMDAELVQVGSHSLTHPILTTCTPTEQQREISESRLRIETMLQREITSFCYPNGMPGDFDSATIGFVRNAGYRCAVAAYGGMVRSGDDAFCLQRLGAPLAIADFKKCIDGAWELTRRLRRQA